VVEILVEVVDGPARTRVAALARSIRRAVDVTRAYYPGVGVRVVYPIDPEAFFARDSAAPAGLFGFEMPEKVAG
jgi:hypothetical protein